MMEKNAALFSGKYTEYVTPKNLFKELDNEFHFVLDPCTTPDNPLGTVFHYTLIDDGLSKSWHKTKGTVFVNPPYGKNIKEWISKAWTESVYNNVTVVML